MEEQALKWWHVRWRAVARRLLPIAILVGKIYVVLWLIAAVSYGVLYLIPPWLGAEGLAMSDPRLSVDPLSLSSQVNAPLSDTSIDRYGFKFLLPAREVRSTYKGNLVTMVSFRNGGGLMLQNTSSESGAALSLAIMAGDKRAEKFIGKEERQSTFKLMQAALSAKPGDVKWWKFRSSENQRAAFLLLAKSLAIMGCRPPGDSAGPVYAISFGQFHGFECGDPRVPPYNAHIDVFDQDNRHFSLDISGPTGHGQVLTQEELNAMVASIRPSPKQ